MLIRQVQATDVETILSILSEVASQVPVKLNTSQHVEKLREQINRYCPSGVSLVAVNTNGVVLGFQLAERRLSEGFRCADEPYIFLAYAGVTAAAGGQKVFRRLIETEKQYGLPLVAEVKSDNKSCMAARLMHYNFHRHDSIDGNYRWDPE